MRFSIVKVQKGVLHVLGESCRMQGWVFIV